MGYLRPTEHCNKILKIIKSRVKNTFKDLKVSYSRTMTISSSSVTLEEKSFVQFIEPLFRYEEEVLEVMGEEISH